MSDASQPPVLEEAVRNAPPTDSNNRGNFTRNLNKEDDASVARKMFLGGLFLLPWLHLANVMFFRKQFMDANVDAQVTLWVRRSFMAFCFTSILFISWVLVFQLNWKEFGWAKLVMVLPPENLDHDAQLDYYGKRLATCSSDRTIKVYDVTGDVQNNEQMLTGHEGPVWQVAWAHPRFGVLLASCSYDGKVIIYREQSLNQWTQAYVHAFHEASVNSIAWAPHEYGLSLACASADGNVSVLSFSTEGWTMTHFKDSALGCNSVSWAPFNSLGSKGETGPVRRLVTGSCDKTIKLWSLREGHTEWIKEEISSAPAHSDWVRDVAWAPSTGMPVNVIASCSEDKHVYVWTQTEENGPWKRELLHTFEAPVWRVSWSITGNVLAVSSGDHKVTLWKETLDKKWIQISSVDEAGTLHDGKE
ncbi:TPA: hypothetical protein N0F65_003061 [Lagenidium giganteum]|uniref:Protein transport protein SEC13 n=1 Tax=Lagenidium giganteum TaxID=4803 RepID=A0AAV2YIT8_9STRA|nr:TPA: hypothetical protein N0F65_003061 [Lagenidium giganteum]